MSESGEAAWIINRTGIDIGVERHDRRFVPLDDDEMEAVCQSELRNFLFEVL
jgi:hypothetical protein